MKVKLLNRDIQQIKKHLDGKRRVMTYGAGAWFNDIKKMLLEYGYKLDYAFIDAPHCNGNISSNGLGGHGDCFN